MAIHRIPIVILSFLFSLPLFAGEPASADLQSIDTSLETVRDVCSKTLDVLGAELRVRLVGIPVRKSHGRSTKNDYRNYQWLSVKISTNEYLLTLHHNNLDLKTGNPHTQFGRVQFLKCAGPNGPHMKDTNGVWRYNLKSEWKKMPKICVWDADYSSARVASLFCEFLTECGETLAIPDRELKTDGSAKVAEVPEDLPLAERQKADAALSSIRSVVSDEMTRVYKELKTRHPEWKIRCSRGNSRKNDYRNYQWITVTVDEKMYIIGFVYRDIDLSTGNIHSQFGRVEFWNDIHYENGRKNEAGPHTKDAGGWRFRYDKQWKDMPCLYLWSPDYSTGRVADLFEQFLAM